MNGWPAGENVMAPGWTNYGKRLLYQTYDVTSLLRPGKNRITGHLGPGWYKGVLARGMRRRNRFGDRVALSLELRAVGGMDKVVFSRDRKAVDDEIGGTTATG